MLAIAPLQLESNRHTRTAFMSLDKLPVCRVGEVFAGTKNEESTRPHML
ncbi:hypothetical protein Oscil6304_3608 [Oscillatoria acuminata PCC 6304]|uniref:Uncharacterized protein n=1 Tax=Oscillatoria acuminata PCC 6304 TaxID=56110 RepID=K9TLZ0_9CYAN|nr:hypothetical protein Oscil6304_3608 [Oscillatoria acuminata PCC 6304]